MRGLAILLLGLAASSCVTDPHGAPIPGYDARVILGEKGIASARWPAAWSRGARFVVENRTGASIETILFDLSGEGEPRELVEAVIEDPAGAPAVILAAPHGIEPLRARLGDPGTVLLEPGATLTLRVRVEGTPGKGIARFAVPR